ncbi:MFS transporter [Haloarculaceae archaeon H-GB2-1]|nr:MFS transporter [Haloarculaceae archaeon H-GB1-1]MEA5387847.1 MFS transporter [Haloarculaceae archaeon H-GB11]MEA5409346.1 MFS transporter [Haloarculaceae archaeon H-GB2-1]
MLGDARTPVGPILKYYVYVASQAAWFVIPIWTLFLLDNDLTYTQLGILSVTWSVATVLGEVPTGYVADRIGRRNALVVGTVVQVVAIAVFGLLSSFDEFLLAYAVWAVAETFRSGTDSAWLYDTLAERMAEETFTRVKGRSTSVRLLVSGVSYPIGGALAGVDLYYPFALSAAVMSVGVVVVLTIPETEQYRTGEVDVLTPAEALPVIRETLDRPALRSVLVALAVVLAVGWSVQMYTQPVVRDTILSVGVAEGRVEPLLGWLYASFTAVGAVVTFNADRVERVVGLGSWLRVVPLVLGGAYLATAIVPLLAIPTFVLMRGLLKTTRVLADAYVNDHTASLGRATVLSSVSMAFSVAQIPMTLLAGRLGDFRTPLWAIGAVGALLVVAGGSLWVVSPTVRAVGSSTTE